MASTKQVYFVCKTLTFYHKILNEKLSVLNIFIQSVAYNGLANNKLH